MFNTRITQMLGIRYPIIQGGMLWVSSPELAAAVSNAGGLGVLTSARCATKEELRDSIKKTKDLTDKPFGVNLSLFPALNRLPNEKYIEAIIEEGVPVVETSGDRTPEQYLPQLKEGNIKVIHKCAASRHAQKAEAIGVDAVAVVGMENGGATGMLNIGTFVLVPATVNAVTIPVIAGGGIADARGFLAALALGAEGVVIGTRFMATHEAQLHRNFKEWLLRSRETDTMVVMQSIRNNHRVLISDTARKLAEMEATGAALKDLIPMIGGEQTAEVLRKGNLEAGLGPAGQAVGLINDVVSVRELIEGMIGGAREILNRLDRVFST